MVEKNEYGFFTLKDKPSSEDLKKYYEEKYYQNALGGYEQNYSIEELKYFRNKIVERFYVIQKHLSSKNKPALLDIGCGEGWVLNFFLEKQWSITGLDYSNYGCDKFNPHCSEHLIVGDIYESLEKLEQQNLRFDVVWLDNVLEHVLEPETLIERIKKIVSSEGLLVIEVPNDFSFLQNFLFQHEYVDRQFWIAVPDHISYFNNEALKNLLNAFGWTTISVLADYPIDWNLLNRNTNYIMDKSLGSSCHTERVVFENLLHQQPIEKIIQFYEAVASVGLGRQIVGIFKAEAK